MRVRVVPLPESPRWEPNAPDASLVAGDDGVTRLSLRAHPDDENQSRVVVEWSGTVAATMSDPNDEGLHTHPLYANGLDTLTWMGEVVGATAAPLRHFILPLKEGVVEVTATTFRVARDPQGFDAARWHWVVDEVLPRVGMWVGRPTYALARAWVEGFGAAPDTFLAGFQGWLAHMPQHDVVANHGWPWLVLREVFPDKHEHELADPDEEARAINHLRERLLEYLTQFHVESAPDDAYAPQAPTEGEWGYLTCQVVSGKDQGKTVVRLPNGSKTSVEPRHLLRQAVRFGASPRRQGDRLIVGDIYEDCCHHPVLCTSVNYDEDTIEGISLLDGSQPRSCSLQHCGVRRLSVAEVLSLRKGVEHARILDAEATE